MKFPKSEAQTIVLAQQLIAGLTNDTPKNGKAPVNAAGLQTQLDNFLAKRVEAAQQEAEARLATDEKDNAFELLTDDMKSDLRFLENETKFDNAALQAFGWAGRKTPTAMQPPEQPRSLEAAKQGENWVFLDWKEPIGGGKAAVYKVQRRESPSKTWEDAATAFESEATLTNQPKAKELEYHVVAVNKAGESAPSNAVTVVL